VKPVRLAVVGAGAVSERCHLPAAATVAEVAVAVLVDPDLGRARRLAARFGVPHTAPDYRRLPVVVDAAVVATPPALHAPVALHFLRAGAGVLVEKPLALAPAEGEMLQAAAAATGAVLQPAHHLRFASGPRLVKRLLEEGRLGALEAVEGVYGVVFDWPVASGSHFLREQAGGGVVMDNGSHLLDLLLWWVGDAEVVEAADDAWQGVEAEAHLRLRLHGPAGAVPAALTLSWLRHLGRWVRLRGRSLTVEQDLHRWHRVRVWPTGWSPPAPAFAAEPDPVPPRVAAYADQLRAFARAVAGEAPPPPLLPDALRALELIAACYRLRRPLDLPWARPRPAAAPDGAAGPARGAPAGALDSRPVAPAPSPLAAPAG